MLLACNMDPRLLARVELGVADSAVVLEGRGEGNRANHTPPLCSLAGRVGV